MKIQGIVGLAGAVSAYAAAIDVSNRGRDSRFVARQLRQRDNDSNDEEKGGFATVGPPASFTGTPSTSLKTAAVGPPASFTGSPSTPAAASSESTPAGEASSTSPQSSSPPPQSSSAPPASTSAVPPPTGSNTGSGSAYNPSVVEGIDKVRGVSLGGWLVYEGWLTDNGGFGANMGWADEWTMAQTYDQNQEYIENHWNTFITEDDIVEIAAAGLNTIRIPVGFWSFVPTEGDEPYRGREVTFRALQNAVGWAQAHNLRVMLDMHGVPGPQAANEAHTGHKVGTAGFFGNDRAAERAIQALVAMCTEFTQPQYGGVVKSVLMVNEPRLPPGAARDGARAFLKQFYLDAHAAIRQIPTTKDLTVMIHDSFDGTERYGDLKDSTGDTNIAMDRHLYSAFGTARANWTGAEVIKSMCESANALTSFSKQYYTMLVGEFAAPMKDGSCSWYEGVDGLEGAQCPEPGDSPELIVWVRENLLAQIEAYERTAGWVFWTWKTSGIGLGWDLKRIIDKVLHGNLGVQRFDELKLDRCAHYGARMPA